MLAYNGLVVQVDGVDAVEIQLGAELEPVAGSVVYVAVAVGSLFAPPRPARVRTGRAYAGAGGGRAVLADWETGGAVPTLT